MEFTLSIWMLMPLAIVGFAVYLLLNREKVSERNRRIEERFKIPQFMRSSHRDPDGRLYQLAAVGMIVIAVFQVFALGTGLIET
ncbi:hypothetical protein [Nesterenkonia sandarakina]|uniref:Uncharacterized protein n=1 Tax=Nesterenkonia sandarakina TaxID=272918 RepID=A0A7Z0EAS5_9MICC|nr:hypothetical protein [Nesterenkonia sandarakina]NYJ18180.1 hypothetical protein [Nesterenkonia sandarakina]